MTASPKFIHLRLHTAYSILEGAIKMKDLAKWAANNGAPAIAMTDTNNIFGAMDLADVCVKAGVQPILGCQLLVKAPVKEKNAFADEKDNFDKVVVLVQNETGYLSLLQYFKLFYTAEEKVGTPHITFDELLAHSDGLLLLTGGSEGILARPILEGHPEFATELAQKLKEAFKDRLYIEIQRHGTEKERQTEEDFLKIAYDLNIPLVATNEAYFITPDMYEAHDALLCIADKTFVDEIERRRVTPEHYLKSEEEMLELFKDLPEATLNTVEIAKRCFFLAGKKKPAFPNYDCGGKTEDEKLAEMAEAGFEMRMQGRSEEERKRYHDRLMYELSIIKTMGFPGYFLIVADFIQWSKANGVPVGPGRGSGAGSVVAWCLTITNIDPLRFNLLFERFLNPERVSMPDFDVDFCQENRAKTIEYVQHKYGFDHVAQILALGQLQAKAVIRDVGRVLQLPYPVVDRLSKLVPPTLGITLQEALDQEPEFQKEAAGDETIARLIEIALKLEGMYRNISMHAAGVVIGNKPLDQIVPLYKDPSSDMPITQYDKHFVEDASLIKFDFLGLKTLTTIEKTLDLIRQKEDVTFDINNLPLEDEKTYELLKTGNTTGVFQLESTGMRKILFDMQPDKIEDIVALVSLYRPGPMDSIPSYIARKKGEETPDYMHPLIEDILKETYGIMIYQEQVMQISQVMAGYTLGGADLLRRAMGKKIKSEMDRQRSIFIDGAVNNNVKRETAELVFDKMAKFAEYGFNKSHAAAYAYIAYQTAFLKAHYPVEFMAATMTLDKTNTDKLAFFKNDLTQMHIEVLPPDINKSVVNFSVENGAVRYALSAVRNVGEAGMQLVVAEREKNGPFKSVQDFFSRVDASALNKRYIENLIKSGAFDCLDKNRAKLFENIENFLAFASNATQSRKSAQINLFGATDTAANGLKMRDFPDWPHLEKLEKESEAIGFYLSAHPLDTFDSVFERLRVIPSTEVKQQVSVAGSVRVQLAGIVSSVRERISQKGNKFAFVTATDKYGSYDAICFSDLLMSAREKLKSGQPLLLTMNADKKPDDEQIRMNLLSVDYLSEVMARTASCLILDLEGGLETVQELKKILSQDEPGRCKIFLRMQVKDYELEVELAEKYALSQKTLEALQHLSGIGEIKQV
ncbi:MAG: DNA polymerase III subunit alpha [Alphaproteobacteria bacterium]|nr:DNA polymerase III subunit alpha [Alphaproteobacteria bacterium]